MRGIPVILFLLLTFTFATEAVAQDYQKMRQQVQQEQESLRSEIEALDTRIEEYQERLSLAEEKYDRLYNDFEELNRVIALQEEKLEKLTEERDHIENEIEVTEEEIQDNEQELDELIENYQQTLRYLYKHGRTSELALLFSSESINQMLVRSYYLGKFDDYRQNQEEQINEQQAELEENRSQLEDAQEKNESVLTEIQAEYDELEERREKQEENVVLLRENKEEIAQEIERIEQERQEQNKALEDAIAEEQEIREAQEEELRRREEERKQKLAEARQIEDEEEREREVERYSTPVTSEDEGFLDDEELSEIEESFASEKGNLPWPVESTTIAEPFGERKHPVYGTVTPSLGIEIITEPGEEVQVVHPGKVISIQPFAGLGDVVMIQHGRFITAYGNLSEIDVRKNDILQQGDTIGRSGDEDSVKGETLFFLIREDNTNLDPETWLTSK